MHAYIFILFLLFDQLVYGSYVTDPCDQLALGAMVDYWISPNAVKKDFELARCKFRFERMKTLS